MVSGQDDLDRAIAAQAPTRARRAAQMLVATHGDEAVINLSTDILFDRDS